MTRTRRWLWLTVVGCHLGLAVTGALGLCLWDAGAIGQVSTYYRALAGLDTGFAFFAPSVGSPPHAEFTMVDGAGDEVVDTLETRVTREADIRVGDLVEVFIHRRTNEGMRRQIAASWAAALLARHPGAEAVRVDVGYRHLPDMAQLRGGATPQWRSYFRGRVVRSSDATGGPL